MTARPYRLLGASDRAAIQAALTEPLAAWGRTWLGEDSALRLELGADLPADQDADWQVQGAGPNLWLAWEQSLWHDSVLSDAMFPLGGDDQGSAIPGPLTEAVLLACRTDLLQQIWTKVGETGAPAMKNGLHGVNLGPGSGCAFARIVGNGLELSLAFGGALLESLAAPQRPAVKKPALQPRQAGLGVATLRLEVMLGDAEISLVELSSLSVGDVIALDSATRDPLSVHVVGGSRAFQAHLGRNAERKVVQVSGK